MQSADSVVCLVIVHKGLYMHDLFWVTQYQFNDIVSSMAYVLKHNMVGVFRSICNDPGILCSFRSNRRRWSRLRFADRHKCPLLDVMCRSPRWLRSLARPLSASTSSPHQRFQMDHKHQHRCHSPPPQLQSNYFFKLRLCLIFNNAIVALKLMHPPAYVKESEWLWWRYAVTWSVFHSVLVLILLDNVNDTNSGSALLGQPFSV